MGFEIALAIGMFTAIVLALVVVILAARAKLVSSGDVNIAINAERTLTVPAGGRRDNRCSSRSCDADRRCH